MKARAKTIIAILGLSILMAWKVKQTNDIEKAAWLLGTWEHKTQSGKMYERWAKLNPREYSGMSFIIRERDTVVLEQIRLVQEHEGLFYIPSVKNQNDGLPVYFVNKTVSVRQLIFENEEHDFPQIIAYTKIKADSMVATISGTKNGLERKQTFAMKRVK